MPASVTIRQNDVLLALDRVQATAQDRNGILNEIGVLMMASVARTFKDEGSPAGSWPALAASTLRRKGYTAGHKLLILSGRLFGSITYSIQGDSLSVGTNLVYAAVHQLGSSGQAHAVSAHQRARTTAPFRRYGHDQRTDKNGVQRNVRVRAQGADRGRIENVIEHMRTGGIPARPYLVFRPEDPARFVAGINAYFQARSGSALAGGAV